MSPLKTQKQGLRIKMLVAALSLVLAAGHICAQERNYDIQPQPLSQALRDYARASGVQIIFTEDLVRGRTAPPLQGEFTAEEALNRLLGGSGLQAEKTPAGAVMIAKIGDDVQAPDSDGQDQAPAGTDSGPDTYEFDIPSQDLASALRAFSRTTGQQVVFDRAVVRGKTSAPLRGTYTADEGIEILLTGTGLEVRRDPQGRLRVEEAVRVPDVPREPEPVTQLERVTVTGTNIRGIAPDSSPTRTYSREDIQITGAATAQDFIQTLPQNFGGGSNPDILSILPNDSNAGSNSDAGTFGASVNLRGLGSGSTLVLLNGHRIAPSSEIGDFTDISMIPASALERVEVLTDGASSVYGGDAVAGVVNFVLREDYDGVETSLRYGSVTEGSLDEYRAGLTGGKNWDTGNVLFAYEFFRQSELSAADRNFSQDAFLPTDLLPSQRRHSAMASISQELTPEVELFADVLFSKREAAQRRGETAPGEFSLRTPESRNLNVSAGAAWEVFGDWVIDVSGTYSRLEQDVVSVGQVNLEGDTDADIWTSDAKASGTVFSIPGGDVKLAIGGHYRNEDFTGLFIVGTNNFLRDAERNVYAGFGEAFIPIFGPGNAVPGVERFEINVSGRVEDYSDFGTTANPKVGVLWSPVDGLNLRGSYSTSFSPPPLGRVGATDLFAVSFPQAFINSIFGFTPPDPSIADIVVLSLSGTDKNLDAESSRAFTGGLDFTKNWSRHKLRGSITYFDIDFEDRLGSTPIPGGQTSFAVPNIAFVSPDVFPPGAVIFFPTADQINEFLDRADDIFGLFGTDPQDAGVIHTVNVVKNQARTLVSGFDFDVAYRYEADFGDLSFGLDGTFLKDFKRQGAVTTPIVEEVDTRFNPVDLKLRGRAGYSRDGFAANIFVNYTDNSRIDNTPDAAPIDSWTTIDVTLSYDTKEIFSNPFLNNTVFRLSVLNLFDEDPPFVGPSIPSLALFNFDPTNASPLNRFISLEWSKRF